MLMQVRVSEEMSNWLARGRNLKLEYLNWTKDLFCSLCPLFPIVFAPLIEEKWM